MNLEFLYVDSDRAAEASNFITEVISQQDMYNERARMKECEKYTPAQILRCVDEDPQSILLCLRDNEILGFISTRDEDDLRWINWFGVARSHHGKGVASALLHVATEAVLLCGHEDHCKGVGEDPPHGRIGARGQVRGDNCTHWGHLLDQV